MATVLVGKELGRVLGVVVAVRGALLDLRLGLDDRLAHLGGDEGAVALGSLTQQLGRAAHRDRSLLDAHLPPGALRGNHLVDGVIDGVVRPRLELGEHLFRGGVD